MSPRGPYALSRGQRRLFESLASVTCPSDAGPLGLVGPIVDRVELLIGAMSAQTRAALALGLYTYELGAAVSFAHPGRLASRLEAGAARRYFDGWWSSSLELCRRFAQAVKSLLCLAYYEMDPVCRRLGYDAADWIEHVKAARAARDDTVSHESRAAPEPLVVARTDAAGNLRQAGAGEIVRGEAVNARQSLECDVVVVGSGAGGATIAAELAEGGLDVVVLEEGGYHPTESFTARPSDMVRALYREAGATAALGLPPTYYQEGCTVGGSSVINGAMMWRAPERVLDRWWREEGVESIRAADLAPYFERVERRTHVATQDPSTIGRDNQLLKKGADALGWHTVDNRRNQLHCVGANSCAFGCPTGAKQSTLVTYIPRAVRFGARIHARVRVERILRAGDRATGVTGRITRSDGTTGPGVRVGASLVVVAGGAIQTPVLLHRSGFVPASGQLGRNLTLHPNVKIVALFDEDVCGWRGVHQAYQVREFQDEGLLFAAVTVPPAVLGFSLPFHGDPLDRLLSEYRRMVTVGVLAEDTSSGRVVAAPGGVPAVFYQLSDRDARSLVRGVALVSELMFAAGARRILPPFDGAPELRSMDDVRRLFSCGVPKRSMELHTVHMMGTARMGEDPSRAVTDSRGRFHGARRLFVCDASLFPSPLGVNPCETIQALATRCAHHILENWRRLTT